MKKNVFLLLVLSLQASVFMAADRAFHGPSNINNATSVSFTLDADQLSAPLDEDQLAELMADLFEDVSESDEREDSPVIGGVSASRSVTQRDLFDVAPKAQTFADRSQQFRGVRSLGTIPELTPVSMGVDSPCETPLPSNRYRGNSEFDSVMRPQGFAMLGIPASQISGSSFSFTRVGSAQLLRPKSSLDRMVDIERAESQAALAACVQPATPISSARKNSCRMM